MFIFKDFKEHYNFCSWNLECFFGLISNLPASTVITLLEYESRSVEECKFGPKNCLRRNVSLSHT